MTTEKRIEQLMDMLDEPEAYSEQDIRNFIADNEEVRDFYQTMVTVRQSYRQAHTDSQPIDVDEAWQRFLHENEEKRKDVQPISRSLIPLFPKFQKLAAAIVGVLLISGLSYAAILQIHHRSEALQAQELAVKAPKPTIATITEKTDTRQTGPKTYDNVPLGEMLPEIAHYYGMRVYFRSEEAKALRLFFTWNPQESADKTISKLNQFERLNVKRDGEDIIVE